MVHETHALLHALTDDGAHGNGAVHVVELDPIIIDDPRLLRVNLGDPCNRAAARQRQHHKIIGVGGVDAPLLVWGDEVENDLGLAVAALAQHVRGCAGIDWRAVNGESLAKVPEPTVILVELLAAAQRPPGNEFMDVGVSCRVADVLAFNARPRGRRDDLARLRHQVAEPNLLVLACLRQMRVVTARYLSERRSEERRGGKGCRSAWSTEAGSA